MTSCVGGSSFNTLRSGDLKAAWNWELCLALVWGQKYRMGWFFSFPFSSIFVYERKQFNRTYCAWDSTWALAVEWVASFGAPSSNIKVPVCHVLHSSFCQLRNAQREDVEQWHSMAKKLPLSNQITCAKVGGSFYKSSSAKNQVKENEMCGLPV